MTYTIEGKEWTEFDINKRCAELMEVDSHVVEWAFGWAILHSRKASWVHYDPCNNPTDTDAIIDKCLDELLAVKQCADKHGAEWEQAGWGCIMEYHNCTKLVAACICFIEINE